MQDCSQGEVLITIPARLAVTDWVAQGHAASALPPPATHWSRTLASRLVALMQDGAANPRAPYLAVLPRVCPTPWLAEGSGVRDAVRRWPAAAEIDRLREVAARWERDAGGDLAPALTRWALSVRCQWGCWGVLSQGLPGCGARGGDRLGRPLPGKQPSGVPALVSQWCEPPPTPSLPCSWPVPGRLAWRPSRGAWACA